MERATLCSVCGALAKPAHTCEMCGAIVCAKCFNADLNLCNRCSGQIRKGF